MLVNNNKRVTRYMIFFLVGTILISSNSSIPAQENNNLISASFNLTFISGTEFLLELEIIPHKISTDKTYFLSDIPHASSEEIGAIKYALFLMVKDQLSSIFSGANIIDFSMPLYQNGKFMESMRIILNASYFSLNSTVNTSNLVNGFLDMGAMISYSFPFVAEEGWNNTFNIYLSDELMLASANTVEVSLDGSVLIWRLHNWDGTQPMTLALLSIIDKQPTTSKQNTEEISISYELDTRNSLKNSLTIYITLERLSLAPYSILPDFISDINYLPADGVRLIIDSELLTWDKLYKESLKPVIDHVVIVLENSSFNQTFNATFQWTSQYTFNASNSYDIIKMDKSPPIQASLTDEKIALSIIGISSRAFFGLLNAGGTTTISKNDLSFGNDLSTLQYPYNISFILPSGILFNGKNRVTWENNSQIMGNFSSENYADSVNTSKKVEQYISLDLQKMDLNIFSIFTGSTEMNAAIEITEEEYIYSTPLFSPFSLPNKMQIQNLNADAFRLCIDEEVFTPDHLANYFTIKKESFIDQYAGLLPDLELQGFFDEKIFYKSLFWDGDISSMDGLTPIHTSVTATSLHTIGLNISIFPPSLSIHNQTFFLTGSPDKTRTFKIQFPKGIDITYKSSNNTSITYDETLEGQKFIEVTLPPSNSNTALTVTCHFTASILYIFSILLPLILTFILVIALMLIMYVFRKRRKTKKGYNSKDGEEYTEQDNYIQRPPAQ